MNGTYVIVLVDVPGDRHGVTCWVRRTCRRADWVINVARWVTWIYFDGEKRVLIDNSVNDFENFVHGLNFQVASNSIELGACY